MSDPSLADLLSVAVDAARLAGQHTLKYFGNKLDISYKSDESPVTRADVESEAIIRQEIARRFPHHAVLGEESGETAGDNSHIRWIIDPLDGTKTFVRGVPLYGVLVGVEINGKPAVGAAYLPATDEMLAAADGLGCTCNNKPARVSTVARLEDASLLTTNFVRCTARLDGFADLASRALFPAGWGDAYGYAMIATGRADILIDPRTALWDLAALVPILREAGGRLTSWSGLNTIHAGDAVATNGLLHLSVLEALKNAKPDGTHIR